MAGRPKGTPKTGGRQKGAVNKKSEEFRKELEKLNCKPLEKLALTLNSLDEKESPDLVLRTCTAMLPYLYPKLKEQTIEHTGNVEHQVELAPSPEDLLEYAKLRHAADAGDS